jgi:toxin ParE1/3/4
MDFKVAWSPEATEDLESIAEYIGRDSEFYARAVATRIVEMTRSIGSLPVIVNRHI